MKKTNNSDIIAKSNLSKSLLTILPMIVKRKSEINHIKDLIKFDTSKSEKYSLAVFNEMKNIFKTIEQLDYIPIFLKRFPDKEYFFKNNINRPQYIKYHLENHYIKILTIPDQISLLFNVIYELGYPERKCSPEAIFENLNTKDNKDTKSFKTFHQETQKFAFQRNLIVHRGIFEDTRIDEIGTFHFVNEVSKEEIIPELLIKSMIKKALKDKIDVVIKNNNAITSHVEAIFNEIEKEFSNRYDKYKFEENK